MKFHLYRGGETSELVDASESESLKVDAIVKTIHYESFMYWENLQSVELPEGLQIIEQGAFAYCTSLLEIHLPSTVKILGEMVFVDCTSLRTVWLSDAVEVLEQSLFENCTSLKKVHMPKWNLRHMKDSCFASCRSLEYLLLPFGLQKIGDWAFARCASLTTLSVPSTVTHVGRYCFQQCDKLLSLEFPQGLTYIGDHCFVDCSNLRSMVIPEAFEFAGSYPLLDRSLLKVCFPDGAEDTYEDESLVENLHFRFCNLPIHNACYYQYQNDEPMDRYESDKNLKDLEELLVDRNRMAEIIIELNQESSDGKYPLPVPSPTPVDEFGMNPLHLLCLSGIPNTKACQLILKHARDQASMLHGKDMYGGTPLTYLCRNRAPGTKEVCETIFNAVVSTTTTTDRLQHIRLDDWKQAITKAMNYALEHWDDDQQHFGDRLELVGRVFYALEYYERKESLSLLECWLWKLQIMKKNRLYDSSSSGERDDQEALERQQYRIHCGADVVIPNVSSFLRQLQEGKYLKDFTKSDY